MRILFLRYLRGLPHDELVQKSLKSGTHKFQDTGDLGFGATRPFVFGLWPMAGSRSLIVWECEPLVLGQHGVVQKSLKSRTPTFRDSGGLGFRATRPYVFGLLAMLVSCP